MNCRRLRVLAPLLALSLTVSACSTPSNYLEERTHDFADSVDVKWACDIFSFGLGFKVEATNYLNAGIGYGNYKEVYEQFGRYSTTGSGEFMHLGIYGLDGNSKHNLPGPATEHNIAFINCCQEKRPPVIDRFRVGGEVLLLGIDAGLYLNLGEMLDFVTGFAGFDMAEDDELARDTEW